MFSALLLGLKRHPWRFVVSIFLSYSVIWTLVESFSHFNPDINTKDSGFQIIAIFISIIVGIFRAYQPRKVTIKINTSDTILNIFFGDNNWGHNNWGQSNINQHFLQSFVAALPF